MSLARGGPLCQTEDMKYLSLTALLLFIPAAVFAQSAMTAEEFDLYTKGKTFYYGNDGAPYGAEEYLENRRVRWSFLDGECKEGRWYPEEGNICFLYEDRTEPQCWKFNRSGAGITARFQSATSQTELYEVEQSTQPMVCLGPEVGV